ncbi:MAG: oligosaccharide flippase family protein [Candidatus Baltobacteraceae bacterium]
MSAQSFAISRVGPPIRQALRSDFVRHSAIVFGAAMLGNIFNYAFNFALSRRLGVEGFATLSSLVSFLMILSIPTSVLSLVVVKYTAIYHAAEDAARVRRLSQLVLQWSGVGAAGLFLVAALLRAPIASFLRIEDLPLIVLTMAIIAVGVVTAGLRSVLQGEQDFVRYSVSTIMEIGIKVAIAVALVYAGFGVRGAMLGWIIGSACALVYTVWAALVKHGSHADGRCPLDLDVRRLVQTTAGVGLATGFLTLISFLDVVLVKHYFSAHQAGLYAAANLTGKVVLFVVAFVPAVVLPKAVAKTACDDDPVPLLLQAGSITLVMSGAALAVFGIFSSQVVRVIAGRDFVAAAQYVLQYDLAMCLLAVLTLLVNYRIGVHRFGFLYALGFVLAAEIGAIAVFHRTLWDVIHILLIGNAAGVAGCLAGLAGKARLHPSMSEAA